LWVAEYVASQNIGGGGFGGHAGTSVGPIAKAGVDPAWHCYAKATCKWTSAAVIPNKRCSQELWDQSGITREAAIDKCEKESNCIGLMWYNNQEGDGRTAHSGRYQGCGGVAGSVVNADWDVILRPHSCSIGVINRADTGKMKGHKHHGNERFVHMGTFTVSVLSMTFAGFIVVLFSGMAMTWVSKRRARRRGVLGNEEYKPMSVREIGTTWDADQESVGDRNINILPFSKTRTLTREPDRSLYLQVEQNELLDIAAQDDPGAMTEEEHDRSNETSRLLLSVDADEDEVMDNPGYDAALKVRNSEWY
jgi:hypothetical protein